MKRLSTPALYLGADHNGFRLKERLKMWLPSRGYEIRDVGARRLSPRDDYPDFASAVARAVAAGKGMGILVCGSGHGMVIAANRFQGVRAALCHTPFSAQMARHDDHANILVLAAWEVNFALAKKIVRVWLKTAYSRATRHQRRIKTLENF